MQIIWTGSHEINHRYRSAYLSSPRRLGAGTGIALSNIPGIRRYCRAIPTKSGIRYDKNPSGAEPPSHSQSRVHLLVNGLDGEVLHLGGTKNSIFKTQELQ